MLWEEQVPLLRQGVHRKLLEQAYGPAAAGRKVYPPRELVFNAMRITAFEQVRVVILGQDPYINEHHSLGPEAHGLCFSVREGIPAPPSLVNIFKEIDDSLHGGHKRQVSNDLTRWARQGVLLLNASLTVLAGRSNSHAGLGWQQVTDDIIKTISEKRQHVVFMLWGAFAQKKAGLIDQRKHLILKTSHPSPLSAHKGFLGSGVFVACNHYLTEHGYDPIDW
ncbi:uracil-DNA glycosylase [Desulfofustis limnaeus]|jgi:uracil-DNA glycosylase|uniref:Uracil-DNA glycosylase n=1 Tax=Desulfofustis limnaeus TaxID=2740163 RepID=A0ABM7W8B3_9BACT|nr:uracil-DNA glycosylase [Desulfofustis limnaeus]MDX9894498.1 uracil-DNA glycosylase [Desulfofustis sp.]BDD87130.1 uracil-DNA glycosylase [Desulfofustis limnaeus]